MTALPTIEQSLRRLVDSVPLPIALLTPDGAIPLINRNFAETFGYAAEEIQTLQTWWPLAYPDSQYREKIIADWCGQLLRVPEGGTLPPYEAEVRCRDGGVRTIEWRAAHLGAHILVVATDLTEHLRDAEALLTSEQRYRLLLENAPEAVVVLDIDEGRFVECNEAAERLFQLSRAALLRSGPVDLSPLTQPGGTASKDMAAAFIARVLVGESPIFEWEHRDSRGQPVACEIRLLRLPDPSRRLIRGSIIDISARKRAEDTLRESEERFRLLVENSTELVAQIDREGRVVYASPNHLTITGRSAESILGRSVFEYVHRDDLPMVLEAFRSPANEASRTLRYRFGDGTWHWLECSGRRFRTSNGSEMAAVISRDITERLAAEDARKQLELQLREAQKMEAIGTLAGGIAHDFNNILTGLFGNLQLATEQLSHDHPVHPLLAESYKACMRARDLVAKILTFSRRREQPKAVHHLAGVMQEVAGLLRASLPTTIEIRTELLGTDHPVLCDPSQIHQVLMNLGTNAAHAMQRGGGVLTLRLDGTTVDSSLPSANPWVESACVTRLQVSDTGCGMDEATRQRIFEPFFTTKPVGEGTGLGLAVVHGIVKDHLGLIAVESAPGAGTTFRMWFPAAEIPAAAAAPAAPARPAARRGHGERVLFIDDEPAVTEVARHILKGLGYQVTACNHGAAAIHAFQAEPDKFDVVVSDLTMPGLTGIQVVERLRLLRPNLPALITTGYMRASDVEDARAVGVQNFLEKPFTLENLADALRRTLGDEAENSDPLNRR